MIRQVRNGVIDEVEDYEAAISIVARELLSYKTLHKEAGHDFDYKSVEDVIETIDRTCMVLLIEDQYLAVVRVYELLFSYDKILDEVLLKRYSKGTVSLSHVITVLESVGKKLGCNRLRLGTLGQKGKALPRLYTRYGFREEFTSMVKEI